MRLAVFGGASEIMPHAAGDVADPGTGDLGNAACPDQHVSGDIRNWRDHMQFASALTDQLVCRREWNGIL